MKIKDRWLDIREDTGKTILAKENTIQDIKNIILEKIETIQHTTMSEERDSRLRQQIGIMFSMVKENFNIYNTLGEAKIWSEESGITYKEKGNSVFLAVIHCILVYSIWFSFSQGLKNKLYTNVGGAIVGFICEAIIVLLILKKYREKTKTIDKIQKTEINIDVEKLLVFMDRTMESMDRYIDEFVILNGLENKNDMNIDKNILEIFQKIDEIEKTDNKQIISTLNRETANVLLSNNIEKLDYSDETEKYFDVFPSKTSSMTIKSAFVDRDSKKVLARGVATKKI